MANTIVRMVPKVRLEAKTGLGTGTATVYGFHLESEDKAYEAWFLWGDVAPSTTFDTAPAGSIYIDKVAGTLYTKDVASGWTEAT